MYVSVFYFRCYAKKKNHLLTPSLLRFKGKHTNKMPKSVCHMFSHVVDILELFFSFFLFFIIHFYSSTGLRIVVVVINCLKSRTRAKRHKKKVDFQDYLVFCSFTFKDTWKFELKKYANCF